MKFLKIIIILVLFNLNNSQVYSIEPDVFVQSTVNRASQILSKNISKEEKMTQLEIIAKETVDIIGIGYYSLGPKRKELDENTINELYNFITTNNTKRNLTESLKTEK